MAHAITHTMALGDQQALAAHRDAHALKVLPEDMLPPYN
jgi:hypothetical protein